MTRIWLLYACLSIFATLVFKVSGAVAQSGAAPGEERCSRERYEAELAASGLTAVIWNENRLFGNIFDDNLRFTAAPDVGSLSSLALWVAGEVDGQARISANHFNVSRFLPGEHTGDNLAVDCRSTRIYRITRGDIERYRKNGIETRVLTNWPWFLGAPVLDGDGDPSNYNLEGGDFPALHGDDMLWFLMSDYSGRSERSLDLEVGVSVYVYSGAGMQSTTLFVRYDITNKGGRTIEDAHVAVFGTPDIPDEFVGTDTLRSMLFSYGANATIPGTDTVPPAVGVVHVDPRDQAPEGGRPPRVFSSYISVASAHSPDNDLTYLRALETRRPDGPPILEGGTGFPTSLQCPQSVTPVKIMFPGDPLTFSFWSMENLTGNPDDCRFIRPDGTIRSDVFSMLLNSEPTAIAPDETVAAHYAVTWAQAGSRFESLELLQEYADLIHKYASTFTKPSISASAPDSDTPGTFGLAIFPNPATNTVSFTYSVPEEMEVRFDIADILGRHMTTHSRPNTPPGSQRVDLDVTAWARGVYLVRYQAGVHRFTRRFVLQ